MLRMSETIHSNIYLCVCISLPNNLTTLHFATHVIRLRHVGLFLANNLHIIGMDENAEIQGKP